MEGSNTRGVLRDSDAPKSKLCTEMNGGGVEFKCDKCVGKDVIKYLKLVWFFVVVRFLHAKYVKHVGIIYFKVTAGIHIMENGIIDIVSDMVRKRIAWPVTVLFF